MGNQDRKDAWAGQCVPVDDDSGAQYRGLNRSFGDPFVFSLARRGFFSEVNNLLNAVLFGLLTKRRLIVEQRKFNGGNWRYHFASKLPAPLPGDLLRKQYWVTQKRRGVTFGAVRAEVEDQWASNAHIFIPEVGIDGNVFSAKRRLAELLCKPRATPVSIPRPYAAIHIRRGDKTAGYKSGSGIFIEGEETPAEVFAAEIAKRAPKIRDVFVLTDDARTLDDMRSAAPGLTLHSLCPENSEGHFQRAFNHQNLAARCADLRRVLSEVQTASKSSLFLGGFLSNIGNFIQLIHHDPNACVSVDRQKTWTPL